MKTYTHTNDKKASIMLFFACWILYFFAYIGRYNFSSALPLISETYGNTFGGTVSMCFFVCYAAGQLINGMIADRISPFLLLICGLFVSSLCNLLSPLFSGFLPLLWGINGYAQSMLWPAILTILSSVMHKDHVGGGLVNISTASPAGTLGAFLFSFFVLKYFSWQHLFYFASALIALGILILCAVYFLFKKKLPLADEIIYHDKNENQDLFKILLISGAVFALVPTAIHGMLKDGVTTWVPDILTEIYSVTPSSSSLLTSLLPLVNLTGSYVAAFIFSRYIKNEIKCCILFYILTLIPLVFILFIGKFPVYTAVILLSLITSLMFGINYIFITLLAVRFKSKGFVCTVSGLFNAVAYFGSSLSAFGFGFLSENYGWYAVTVSWIVLCIMAIIFLTFSNKRWKSFIISK